MAFPKYPKKHLEKGHFKGTNCPRGFGIFLKKILIRFIFCLYSAKYRAQSMIFLNKKDIVSFCLHVHKQKVIFWGNKSSL